MALKALSLFQLVNWLFINQSTLEQDKSLLDSSNLKKLTNFNINKSCKHITISLSIKIYNTVLKPIIESNNTSKDSFDESNNINILYSILKSNSDDIISKCKKAEVDCFNKITETNPVAKSPEPSSESQNVYQNIEEVLTNHTNTNKKISIFITNLTTTCASLLSTTEIPQTSFEIQDIITESCKSAIYSHLINERKIRDPTTIPTEYESFLLDIFSKAFTKALFLFLGKDLQKYFYYNKILEKDKNLNSLNCINIIKSKILTESNINQFIPIYNKTVHLCAEIAYKQTSEDFSNYTEMFIELLKLFKNELNDSRDILFGQHLLYNIFLNSTLKRTYINLPENEYLHTIQDFSIINVMILKTLERSFDYLSLYHFWTTSIKTDKILHTQVTQLVFTIFNNAKKENQALNLTSHEINHILFSTIIFFKIRNCFLINSKSLNNAIDFSESLINQNNWLSILFKQNQETIELLNLSPYLCFFEDCFLIFFMNVVLQASIPNLENKLKIIYTKFTCEQEDSLNDICEIFSSTAQNIYLCEQQRTLEPLELKNSLLLFNLLTSYESVLFNNFLYNKLELSLLYSEPQHIFSSLPSLTINNISVLSCFSANIFLTRLMSKSFTFSVHAIIPDVFLIKPNNQNNSEQLSTISETLTLDEFQFQILIKAIFAHKKYKEFYRHFTTSFIHNTKSLLYLAKSNSNTLKHYKTSLDIIENFNVIIQENNNLIIELSSTFIKFLSQRYPKVDSAQTSKNILPPTLHTVICLNTIKIYFQETILLFHKKSNPKNAVRHALLLDLIEQFYTIHSNTFQNIYLEILNNIKRNNLKMSNNQQLKNILISIILHSVLYINLIQHSKYCLDNESLTLAQTFSLLFSYYSEQDIHSILKCFNCTSIINLQVNLFTLFHIVIFDSYANIKEDFSLILQHLSCKTIKIIQQLASQFSNLIKKSFNLSKLEQTAIESEDELSEEDEEEFDQSSKKIQNICTSETASNSTSHSQESLKQTSLSPSEQQDLEEYKVLLNEQFGSSLSEEQKEKLITLQITVIKKIYNKLSLNNVSKPTLSATNKEQDVDNYTPEDASGTLCFEQQVFTEFSRSCKLQDHTTEECTSTTDTSVHLRCSLILQSENFSRWLSQQTTTAQDRISIRIEYIKRFGAFGNSRQIKSCSSPTFELKITKPALRIYYRIEKNIVYIIMGGDKQNQKQCIAQLQSQKYISS